MTPFLLTFLLLFTIVAAFVFGIALGYWTVCGILHLFSPVRPRNRTSPRPNFAPSTSGD